MAQTGRAAGVVDEVDMVFMLRKKVGVVGLVGGS